MTDIFPLAADQQLVAKLAHLVAKTDLTVTDKQLQLLVMYIEMMHKWNKAYNLTSIRQIDDMLVKHVLDSIVVAPLLRGKRFIDVGTGPGLPGIPLAIMHPNYDFVLLDSLGKRVRFMQQVAYALKLNNISPVQSRVEDYQDTTGFDGVISRAFASIKDMLHWCGHLVNTSGEFVALKGQYPESELTEMPAHFELKESVQLHVPQLIGERHLIRITSTHKA
ncbi:MAG: Ribosomal RNA small subunit methyltransferase G [Glaciecola sp. HTCC2999]|nr:MAG: Ribosomal RNA small subunit methyltransferase G [Glaciecola sp. HTCC2999]